MKLDLRIFAACLYLCALPTSASKPTTPLKSPWDSLPIKASAVPFDCGPAAPIGPDINITGRLESNGKPVSDELRASLYSESTFGLQAFTARVIQAADTYRATGSEAAAHCVVSLLSAAASNHALTGFMSSSDAWKEQNHALRAFAIAWLKVRGDEPATPPDERLICDWLESVVHMERSYYEGRKCNLRRCYIKSHWGIETAMAAAAIGIAAQDQGFFQWSLKQYNSAVHEIDGEGMLRYDSLDKYAFKNNLASAASLVQIAEFAAANNISLYDDRKGSIHLLVHTVALGIVNPSAYRAYTKDNQVVPHGIQPWEIAWATVYNHRFPDPVVTSLLQQVGSGGVDMWGGEPFTPENPSAGTPSDANQSDPSPF